MSQNPFDISISDYNYHLPEERIAVFPLEKRDDSKLLVYENGTINETHFKYLHQQLPPNSFLVFNNTKVTKARLNFFNNKGQMIEVFCLEPHTGGVMASALSSKGSVKWNCLVGNLKRWKEGELKMVAGETELAAELLEKKSGYVVIEFNWQPKPFTFAEILERFGKVPIPPYLNRESEAIDDQRYQTVYARFEGSVAAPTAGLHFTDEIFENLKTNSVDFMELTLHVGAGTFKPVKSEFLRDHEMHQELIEFDRATLYKLKSNCDKNIICVGTTSLRTLESIYWMGLKAYHQPNCSIYDLEVKQWDPYTMQFKLISVAESIEALLTFMEKLRHEKILCRTGILIAPPYELKIARGIITNFHQPQSTLLLLVSAIVGSKWKDIYNYALQKNFRFLSYGDSSLLLK